MSVYTDNGYDDRCDYLARLSEDYGIEPLQVRFTADLLGEEEDFDGLITWLENNSDYAF
jgi:hypothetical protein